MRFLSRRRKRSAPMTGWLSPGELANLVAAIGALFGARCLSRSIVLWHDLMSRGVDARVCLGVRLLPGSTLAAHAWVEVNGEAVNDSCDVFARYAVLPSIFRDSAIDIGGE